MHPRHRSIARVAVVVAATLAVCGAFAAPRPDDRTPLLRSLDSLFYAGRYDTLQVILPALIRQAEARGDSAALGRLVFHEGRVEITLGHQAVANTRFDRAIRLTEAARDTVGLLPALHFKAFVLRDRGDPDAAMVLFERERELGRRARVLVAEASAIGNLAYRDLRRGELDKAKRGYAESLSLLRRSGNTYAIAGAGLSLGQLHRALGDIDSSLYWYREALRLARQHRFPMHELWALNNIGLMEMDTGNWESAASYYQSALVIGRRIGFDRGQALPLMNLSLVWSYLGEIDRAQRALDECLEVSRRAGFKDLEVGNTTALAVLNLESGRNRQAAALFRRNVNREFVFNQLQRNQAAYGLGLALAQMDSVGAALQVLEPYVSPRVEAPDFTVQAYFEIAYAELLYRVERYDEALARAVTVRDEMDRTGRTDLGVAARLLESSCRRALGDPARAAGSLSIALDSLEVARTEFGDVDWREAYGQHVMGDVIEGCRVMLQYPPDAPREERVRRFFDTLQRFKTRTLLERIRDPSGDNTAVAGPALTQSITLEQLQGDVLQPGELLLDLFVTPRETYLFAVSSDSCRMVSLPGGHSRLAGQVFLYADLMSTSARATRDAYPPARLMAVQQTLGESLIGPVADLIGAAKHVVVAPDGFFASIPFGTLILGDERMLMERVDVVEVPSASVLQWARANHPNTNETACLVTVDGGVSDRALEGARREVSALKRRYAGVDVVPASPGILDSLSRRAQPACILHVAAHARVNDESPWQSGFQLASDTSSAPGMTLRAWEIARTRLPYAMSVLAGCETAGGRATNGEGVLGLTSAFLSAGVPVVVSSRWPVDDAATADLVKHFYDRLSEGKNVAAALREAQLAVRSNARTSHPFYWAGFAVVGDGTRVVRPALADNPRALWIKAVAGAALAVGLAGWTWRRRRAAVPAQA